MKIFNILGAATLSCILLSCAMPAEPSAEASYGMVSISFADNAARTVLPAKTFETYTYTFTKGGTSTVLEPDGAVFRLEPGTYTVAVNAYIGEVDPDNIAATGSSSAPFQVTVGAVTPVTVNLTGETNSGDGTFKYRIGYPSLPQTHSFTMKKLTLPGGVLTESNTDILAIPASDWGVSELTNMPDGDSVPAGFYLATVIFEDANHKKAGKTEVVHIYNKMTTVFDVGFDQQDFVGEKMSGTVIIDNRYFSGSIPVLGDTLDAVYTDDDPLYFDSVTGITDTDGLTYQWYRHTAVDGMPAPITGATGSFYTVLDADVGNYLSVRVMRLAVKTDYVSSLDPVAPSTTPTPPVGPVKMGVSTVAALTAYLMNPNTTGGTSAATSLEVVFTDHSLNLGTIADTVDDATHLNGKFVSIDFSRLTSTSIAANLFDSCTKLTAITLPSTIASIGNRAFSDCSSLSTVICLAEAPPTLGTGVFASTPTGMRIEVPSDYLSDYQTAWSAYSAQIVAITP
ncbi:MAG: leucine-rich repeat domain-containing protein [Spirochaetaceae bacterium]|jgi:hypothetical protein|nr:leucine-rich repeat domain-containing protein [Spirochaetaceae bacterium]